MGLYKSEKELLVIMPAYNEEKSIEKLLKALAEPPYCDFLDVLVMNDASSDSTGLLVKKYGHSLVSHVYNLGYGSAIQVGYKYAIRRDYKYVIQIDADGQHDLSNIDRIYERLKQEDAPDIVLGSRFLEGSGDYPISHAKRLAHKMFRFVIRCFTGRTIADPTTGLQGLSRRATLHYSKYNQFDFTYPDANMIMQMLLLGFKVVEIPAVMHPRQTGKSMHSGLRPLVYMFQMTISILAVLFRIRVLKEGEPVDEQVDFLEE
jgi:glycosyltransferase involved in cell wall biosynthesis